MPREIRELEPKKKCLLLIDMIRNFHSYTEQNELTTSNENENFTERLIEKFDDIEKVFIKLQRSIVKDFQNLIKEDEIVIPLVFTDRIAEAYYTSNRQFDFISFREKIYKSIYNQYRKNLKELDRV